MLELDTLMRSAMDLVHAGRFARNLALASSLLARDAIALRVASNDEQARGE